MNYTRIYCGADGESHFEDVPVELASVDFAPPAPPLNVAAPVAAERVILLEDTTGKGHLTRVVGDAGVEAVFVQVPEGAEISLTRPSDG
jgi:hypothetical protein